MTDIDHESIRKEMSPAMSLSVEVGFQLQLYCFDCKV